MIDNLPNESISCLLDPEEKVEDNWVNKVRGGVDSVISWIPIVGDAYDGITSSTGQSIKGKVPCTERIISGSFLTISATLTAISATAGAGTGAVAGAIGGAGIGAIPGAAVGGLGSAGATKLALSAVKTTVKEFAQQGSKKLIKSFTKTAIKELVTKVVKETAKNGVISVVSAKVLESLMFYGGGGEDIKEISSINLTELEKGEVEIVKINFDNLDEKNIYQNLLSYLDLTITAQAKNTKISSKKGKTVVTTPNVNWSYLREIGKRSEESVLKNLDKNCKFVQQTIFKDPKTKSLKGSTRPDFYSESKNISIEVKARSLPVGSEDKLEKLGLEQKESINFKKSTYS